ncbi:hypothetical protein RD792_008011, partial [Penstemon davidsonii]
AHVISLDSSAIVLKDETEKVNVKELPLFTFKKLSNATDKYHEKNLLGRGGFGLVYKGEDIWQMGKKIGVKRLSTVSRQDNVEFMNEVVVISKLQHRNLVTLIGCCVEIEEKMLIYEYMPNYKSLDGCLFDPNHLSQKILDWKKRFNIIEDVYSFSVLMLEIISGKKNTHYCNHELSLSLLGCAWKLWNEENGLDFVDQTIKGSNFQGEIVICIHIVLLCVQDFLNDKPAVQKVLSMLNREIIDLPRPYINRYLPRNGTALMLGPERLHGRAKLDIHIPMTLQSLCLMYDDM